MRTNNLLDSQVLRRPCNMVVCKSGHEVVAVVVIGLQPEVDALFVARLLSRLDEVLGKKLLLLVEIVAGTLRCISMSTWEQK
jgi:hypothetical protein